MSFFGFGLLLAFTPCVFPMIPILSGIIAGSGENISTRRAFVLSVVYVLATCVVFTIAGVVAGLAGANLQAAFQKPWILWSFAILFVLLSLSMFGFYELQLPSSWQSKIADISNKQKGGSLIGVAIMGLLSALIVGPVRRAAARGGRALHQPDARSGVRRRRAVRAESRHGRAAGRVRHRCRKTAAARGRVDGRGQSRVRRAVPRPCDLDARRAFSTRSGSC